VRRITILLAALAALMLVPAAQAFANENLTLSIEGSGAGEVTSNGTFAELEGNPPIECSYASPGPQTGNCETEMTYSEEEGIEGIDFKANPAAGSEIAEWRIEEGNGSFLLNCNPGETSCLYGGLGEGSLEAAEVVAVFNAAAPSGPPLTLKIEEGSGTVVSNPAGIECTGAAPHECTTEEIAEGEEVTLTASPASGYAFSKWKGCATHVGLTCTVTLNEARTVGVYFVATTSVAIEKAGSGAGTAKAGALGCDESCSGGSAAVQTGKTVKVTTKPAKGSEEGVISGGTGSAEACNGESHCEFPAGADQTLTVTFAAKPMKTLTLDLTGPAAYKGKVKGKAFAKGLVKSSFSCGAECSTEESFFEGDNIELTASASTGYTFAGWTIAGGATGTCTGTTSPCSLPVDADKTIEAEFK
jgi:Divergent InlB B-repeat domain